MLDIQKISQDFPILARKINGYPLAYLDNAATTQKPRQVVEAMSEFYYQHNANVHRGVHTLSDESTAAYAEARQIVADFIGAKAEEIIFVRNATEALNLVAYGWGLKYLKKGDEVVVTEMEHHSNLVPWQLVCEKTGAVLKVVALDEEGRLVQSGKSIQNTPRLSASPSQEGILVGSLEELLSSKTKIVSLVHVSNALGTINPVREICKKIKKFNKEIICVVDGAQSVPHMSVKVTSNKYQVTSKTLQQENTLNREIRKQNNNEAMKQLDNDVIPGSPMSARFAADSRMTKGIAHHPLNCDFLAFSGHKMLGPMGIGVLWGRKELLEQMSPFFGGGDMIAEVYLSHSTWNQLPYKFEAGTPNVAGAVGLAEAVRYLSSVVRHSRPANGRIGNLGISSNKTINNSEASHGSPMLADGQLEDDKTKVLSLIQQHEHQLLEYLIQELKRFPQIRILGSEKVEERGGLVAFEYKGVHAHDVAQVLDSLGIAVRSGHHCTMPLHERFQCKASVRVAPYLYNSIEEMERVVEGLEKVESIFRIK